MEFKYGNLIFSSNFDSGNLLNVERVSLGEDITNYQSSDTNRPDYEFHVWTRPDNHGTEFENGNRTWFHFSVKGYLPNRLIRLTIRNLNRQQRLYSQGYCPLYRTESAGADSNKWFRIRFRPTWESIENNFQLTFLHRFSELKNTVTYFAFCYPWSYNDCQKQLEALDDRFKAIQFCSWERLSKLYPGTIYYNRELITKSLDGRRIDLLTITDLEGLQNEREDKFDEKLFCDSKPRPWKFANKKVFVVTSRVHPGETPSSHVFNGFLEFILREDDVRSSQLRKKFIFKLIPLLNPDGVVRGHYRTDTRGVNLNRVYLYPDFKLHPSIYAAKSLLVYHHIVNSSESINTIESIKSIVFGEQRVPLFDSENVSLKKDEVMSALNIKIEDLIPNKCKEIDISPVEDPVREKVVKQNEMNLPPLQICSSKESCPQGSLSSVDFLEVLVDVEIPKFDLLQTENSPIENEIQSDIPNDYVEEGKDSDDHVVNTQDLSASVPKSVYKFLKFPTKRSDSMSKSIDSIQKPVTEHQWNFRNFKLPSQTSNLQQLVKPYRKLSTSMIPLPLRPAIVSMKFSSKKMNKITINSAQLSKMKKELQLRNGFKSEPRIGNEGSDDDSERDYINDESPLKHSVHLSDPSLLTIPSDRSGIAFYVDLHGHCSKRGCFIYGNCLESETDMISNLLFPKLISLNSAHFDFSGCNFSIKNMYTRDKRDGSSKEGAGRVAIWKHLGLVHSYTLECNYNTGRIVNAIPQVFKDDGRVSPPGLETMSLMAPRYTPSHFEDVGKAMAISALDIFQINPLSRVMNSEYNNLHSLIEYLKKYIYNQKLGNRSSCSYKTRNVRQNKTHPSNSSVSSTSKPFSNSLDNRRVNSTQNSVTFSSSRKFQPSQNQIQRLSSNSKLPIKPVFSNEVILNSHQLDILQKDVDLEYKRSNIASTGKQDSENGHNRTHNTNFSYSASKYNQGSRPEDSKPHLKKSFSQTEKISCDISDIVIRNNYQETPADGPISNISKENFDGLPKFKDEIPQLQSHSDSKSLLPLRRNSIANCYVKHLSNDGFSLRKEKAEKINELVVKDQSLDAQVCHKAYSFNYESESQGVRKKEVKNKHLGKLISYSANDIHS